MLMDEERDPESPIIRAPSISQDPKQSIGGSKSGKFDRE